MKAQLMLPYHELQYYNGILTLVDGKLNPCFLRRDPDTRTKEQKQKEAEQERRNELKFNETYKKLNQQVKSVTIAFKDGHISILDPQDPEFGWRIRWSIKDLLRDASLPKKLGYNQFGTPRKRSL